MSLLRLAPVVLLAIPALAQTPLRVVKVDGFYRRPVDMQVPPGDEARLFVVSQYGTIHLVKNDKLQATPFLDMRSLVRCCSERGLLGMAFHPDYARNGWFYVNYTRSSDGATMVERFTRSTANPDLADPASRRTIIGPFSQPYSNHNGGCIQFGPDNKLYIGTGDGGSGGDPGCRAQNGASWMGKMLRIDVSNPAGGYTVPQDNPFVKNAAFRNEIWSYGWRNPWRFSFDRVTGDMYVGDVGQNAREEISFQFKGIGGGNYGWKFMEGNRCYGSSNCTNVIPCNDVRLIKPIYDYVNPTVGRSVTGGYVYRGCAIPDLRGTYFFSDYQSRRTWSFRYDGKAVSAFQDRTTELGSYNVSSFGQDARGELYIVALSGSIYKIVPNAPPPVQDLGFGKIGGNGLVPRFDACGLLTSGNTAELRLARAPTATLAILVASSQRNPTNIFGGMLLPVPMQLLINFVTDSSGTVRFTVPGGGGKLSIYTQYVILDPKASFGFGFSNALRVDFQ
ncbi:MAG: glucose dehydrogenase [Planctomycetes bacterium]|nr:glucose dehydrogenase [Planctomycetota bacterium]MDP6423793.1 PQQ-dependent sugar dehydrogenase [Planctomycetota bacterium]